MPWATMVGPPTPYKATKATGITLGHQQGALSMCVDMQGNAQHHLGLARACHQRNHSDQL